MVRIHRDFVNLIGNITIQTTKIVGINEKSNIAMLMVATCSLDLILIVSHLFHT